MAPHLLLLLVWYHGSGAVRVYRGISFLSCMCQVILIIIKIMIIIIICKDQVCTKRDLEIMITKEY